MDKCCIYTTPNGAMAEPLRAPNSSSVAGAALCQVASVLARKLSAEKHRLEQRLRLLGACEHTVAKEVTRARRESRT
jgi:hypothetical protein